MLDIRSSMQQQLARMQSLCTVEAEEYQKGRNLQVLQPPQVSLPTIVSGSQHTGMVGDSLLVVRGAAAEMGDSTTVGITAGHHASASSPGASGHQQAFGIPQAAVSLSDQHADAAVGPTTAVGTPSAAAAKVSVTHMQTPLSNQLEMPRALLQASTSLDPAAALLRLPDGTGSLVGSRGMHQQTAGTAQAQVQLPQPITAPAVQAAAPLLLQQTNSAPLMQQVLQKQRQQQGAGEVAGKQQASSAGQRNDKRKGYCIEPDALKRVVERQLQLQREKQEAEKLRRQQEEQQALLLQQQQLQALAQQQQQQQLWHYQQQYQQSQRLQLQQHHRQRSLPRLSQEFRHHLQQLQADQAAITAGSNNATADQPVTLAAPAAIDPALQLQLTLESPGKCMGLSLSMDEVNPAVGLDIESSKLFGSAQKRLRLSICDVGHHGSLLSPPAAADQLAQALVSPVLLAGVSGLETPAAPAAGKAAVGPAASGAAALTVALLEAEAPTPSKFFAPSPVAAVTGATAIAGVLQGVTAAMPGTVFATPSKGHASSSAGRSKDIAPAAVKPEGEAGASKFPGAAYAAPSKFFAESPIAAEAGIPAASGAPTISAAADDGPTFITPSKFFNCSPASADRQAGKPMRDTPITPLLFGHPTSPWSRQQGAHQQQQGLMTSSNPLRTARRSSTDAAGQPSGWVPVAEHSHCVQLSGAPEPAAATATPASEHVRVGLFRTPMTAAAPAIGRCESACDGALDPAAAAAAPVDIEALRRRTGPAAARDLSTTAAPSTAAAAAEKSVSAAGVPVLAAGVGVGGSLLTPPVQEQQVTVTPLTQVV